MLFKSEDLSKQSYTIFIQRHFGGRYERKK
jgi:hypothetical protein